MYTIMKCTQIFYKELAWLYIFYSLIKFDSHDAIIMSEFHSTPAKNMLK